MLGEIALHARASRLASASLALFLSLGAANIAQGVDFDDGAVEWEFRAGLDKAGFKKAFDELGESGFRIADLEAYRSGRAPSVSALWTKLGEGERWVVEMSMAYTDFTKAIETHGKGGFQLVDLEIDRNGATLHFSGVWLKTPRPMETRAYFGMEELEFSNRYGEMADSGYRLIDFQPYEANGKLRNAAIWLKDDRPREVRFYRGIAKDEFLALADRMEKAGFRLLEVEGYEYVAGLAFAGEWVRLDEGATSAFAVDLLADEFFSRHAAYVAQGYRLTEFEVYADQRDLRYAGSWLKPALPSGTPPAAPVDSKKRMSLEEFRN